MMLVNALKKPGLPLSLGMHTAVLVAGLVSFSSPKKFEDATEAVSVEIVDESQLREITKGEKAAKQPASAPRVDRVDDKKEQNAPGDAKRQVNTDTTPKPQEATAKEERKEVTAAVAPPKPVLIVPPKPIETPKPVEPPKPVAAKPAKPVEATDEEEDEADEVVKQAKPKKIEPAKPDQAALARLLDQQKAEDAKRQEQIKNQQAKQEQAQEEARKAEERKKVADAKAADDKKKADAAKAQEAAKKAAEERKKREADQEAKNQSTADAARRALLASREAPSNSGNTGQQVSRTPAAGAPTATGQRLNPSDRAALAGLLGDQIRSCWNITVSGRPSPLPQVRIALNADGSLSGAPTLVNSSGDPNFRALADSGMRAIRQCSPFRIPARFAPTFNDWRTVNVQLNPDD
jgi:colicin import membrane protein